MGACNKMISTLRRTQMMAGKPKAREYVEVVPPPKDGGGVALLGGGVALLGCGV